MKNLNTTGGFTLIELLVVVLIIGILSSIALPQYTKAVEKARASEAMAFAADWVTAQSIYKMANGHYAKAADSKPSVDLDITMPTSQVKYFTVTDSTGDADATLTLERTGSSTSYTLTVVMQNKADDGSDTITRTCNGKICKAIISGLEKSGSSTASNGVWTATGTGTGTGS